jgi:hypothetical protein
MSPIEDIYVQRMDKIRFPLVVPLAAVLELGSEASLSEAEEAEGAGS